MNKGKRRQIEEAVCVWKMSRSNTVHAYLTFLTILADLSILLQAHAGSPWIIVVSPRARCILFLIGFFYASCRFGEPMSLSSSSSCMKSGRSKREPPSLSFSYFYVYFLLLKVPLLFIPRLFFYIKAKEPEHLTCPRNAGALTENASGQPHGALLTGMAPPVCVCVCVCVCV